MRLLILSWRDLRHPRAGGSEVYVQSVARCWAAAGHAVTMFAAGADGLPDTETVDGYTVVRRGNALTVYREARRFFQADPGYDAIVDVVNTRPFLSPRWAAGTPVLALIHQVARDVWDFEVPTPAALLGRYVLEPRWLNVYRDTPVATLSESSRASLREYGLRHVSVVPVGVDPPLNRPLPPKAPVPTWLFVGRLAPNKRPDHAVLAHRELRRALPDAVLRIVGDGPMADEVRALAGPGVELLGRVDQATKQDLMAAAHAVVGTAVREGWGMTVSEAARLGTRAIGYDVPGLADSIPAAGGVLVEATPEALAAAAARWLPVWMQEGRADLGDAGVSAWEDVADAILAQVDAAVGDGAGSPPRPWRRRPGAGAREPSVRGARVASDRGGDLGPRVGVVVPTRNSARSIERCLQSLAQQTEPCTVVVVDNDSTDGTAAIASRYADAVLSAGPERSAQRNAGTAFLATPVIAYVDSDMELEPDVARQAAELITAGAGGVIVPETSFGEGFWAEVRAFERSFYEGDDTIEAARFFARSAVDAVGGYDEQITGPEDWDLSMRVRAVAPIARTSDRIWHDEGSLTFRAACAKKAHYAEGIADFGAKHGGGALVSVADRPYFRRPWELLWPRPLVGAGVVALKAGEATAVLWRLLASRYGGA